ncbi:MAG: polysaccharide pyruvyl transferase family protein, partial [Vulcanimicrobiaceae bacterium]
MRLFVGLDYFGAGNMGDDLMLAGFLHVLATQAPQADVTICTPHDIASQRLRFPSVRWLAGDESTRESAAREADVWLGLGDTPFQLDSGPSSLDLLMRECERCARLGLPMVFLGAGCESAAAADDPRTQHVLAHAARVWTRDARSAELLAAHAPRDLVVTGADLAHAYLGSVTPPATEPGIFGLLLAFERAGTLDVDAVEGVVAARAALTTRWLVQEARSFPFTERFLYAMLSGAVRAGVSSTALDYARDSLATYLAAYGAPETVVSSRYHGTLVAAWHGARVAVVARSGKLLGAADDLDLPSAERVTDAGTLERLIDEAHPVDVSRLRALHERALAMCKAFFAGARDAAEGRLHGSRTFGDVVCEVPRTVNETLVTASPAPSETAPWDQRELEHIRQAIFGAPLRTEPSEYEYVEGFFSDAVYAEILRQFPTDPEAFRRWRNPGDSAVRFANYSQRQEISMPDDADRLPTEQRDFWLGMWNLLCGPAFARVLFARFGDYVRRRFGDAVDDPSFIDERVRGTMILNQHDADYFLGPHTDRGEKLFTCVFYFPEREGLEHLGTTLYEPLDAGFTCPGTAHHDPARFRRGETMPYRANSALVFARTDVMFHGVHPLTAEELQDSRRRGIQMQFYVRNERRPEECKITLDVPMPEQMRAGTGDSIAYRLTNRAAVELASSAPYTTQLGYRWFDAQGRAVDAESGVGTPLPGALAPGETRAGFIRIVAPSEPGRYQLRVSAVQANVA